ncbi:MAG: 4Fe-4S dicluster domain-containing protein [Firmicutes bacterium]|nr:4Fe-4S dicluster domain-containing protein [Bacillota bacterium]
MEPGKPCDLYVVERCRNCPNVVIDLDRAEKIIREAFESAEFNRRQSARLQRDRPLHHQVFKAAVAGCPNSCSQPQIKDFGVQGQLVPTAGGECSQCGACAAACPDKCIDLTEAGPEIDRSRCLNCGSCIKKCPTGAMQALKCGYRVLAGGKLGRRPRLATVELELASEKELGATIRQLLEFYFREGRPGERLGHLLERSGDKPQLMLID